MKCLIITFCLLLFVGCAGVYSPTKIRDWSISCGVDKGAIVRKQDTWIFKTSKNKCKGGTFKQRAEIKSNSHIGLTVDAKYNFETTFKFESNFYEKFDIFQIHDGRDGCAPPLKVTISSMGYIRLRSDYKTGPGENCVRDVMKSSGRGLDRVLGDGTEQKLNVILDFDGKGGFDVEVYLDDKLQVTGEYKFEEGKGYIKSKDFYFKHGVYSKRIFEYQLTSKMSMMRID